MKFEGFEKNLNSL